jgi:hypothetical protein
LPHGRQERWDQFTTLTARVEVGGPFWAFNGQADFLGDELVVASTRSEKTASSAKTGTRPVGSSSSIKTPTVSG